MKHVVMVAVSMMASCAWGQMNFESRLSSVRISTRSGASEFHSYSGFGLYNRALLTNLPPGARARQNSMISTGEIAVSGSGSAGGPGGPGQLSSHGESSMAVIFTVSQAADWTFTGNSDSFYLAEVMFRLRNLDTDQLLMNFIASDVRDFNGSGNMAAGRYEFTAYFSGSDGGSAAGAGTFTVVPTPATTCLLAGTVLLRRRRRSLHAA